MSAAQQAQAPDRYVKPRRKKSQVQAARKEAMAASKLALGRPRDYSPEVAEMIVRRVQNGAHYRELIKEGLISSHANVCQWKEQHPEFSEALDRAQDARAELWADELISIADDKRLDPNDRRIRIDTRWKVINALLHRRYGAKQTVDINQNINVAVLHAEQLMALTQAAKETPQIEDHSLIEGEIIE